MNIDTKLALICFGSLIVFNLTLLVLFSRVIIMRTLSRAERKKSFRLIKNS